MPTEDDVAFLESFREKITAFLAAGAAPTQDLLWGGRALIKMTTLRSSNPFAKR